MQYLMLRKEASSKLVLFTAVALLLLIVAVPVMIWVFAQEAYSLVPTQSAAVESFLPIVATAVIVVMIPVLGAVALPVIALLMIYTNANSGGPLKSAGYSLLRGMMIAYIVMYGFSLLFSFLPNLLMLVRPGGYSYTTTFSLLSSLLNLFSVIACFKLLTALREIVRFGYTYRRFPESLPILLIISLFPSAVSLLLIVLANTVPSLTVKLESFRIPTATMFYFIVGILALALACSVLIVLLCYRCKKVLNSPKAFPVMPTE